MNIQHEQELQRLILKQKLAISYSERLVKDIDLTNTQIVEISFDLAERMAEVIDAQAKELQQRMDDRMDSFSSFFDEIMASIAKQNGQVQ